MREGQVLLRDAHVDHAGREGRIGEAGDHRLVAARGVDDHVGQLAVGEGGERGDFGAVALGLNDSVHLHHLGAEFQAVGVHVHHHALRAGDLDELHGRKADGAGADDEHRLAGLGGGAVDGVAADGERLDERKLVVGKLRGDVELAGRQEELLGHAAVAHHAERLMVLAAVGETAAAAIAGLAVDVRLDRATIARLDVRHARADREDFDAELMARDARVGVERHLAEVAAVVGAADADAVDADDRFAGGGRGRLRDVDPRELLRLVETDGLHRISYFPSGLPDGRGSSPERRWPAPQRGAADRSAPQPTWPNYGCWSDWRCLRPSW